MNEKIKTSSSYRGDYDDDCFPLILLQTPLCDGGRYGRTSTDAHAQTFLHGQVSGRGDGLVTMHGQDLVDD